MQNYDLKYPNLLEAAIRPRRTRIVEFQAFWRLDFYHKLTVKMRCVHPFSHYKR